ncbi:methyltransferase domain-containing protein [Paraburkholderia hospita]|uniref:methyltransferase domain-containing protein n=1 Tax=Paraburkholderia hospita TaxID=169430 RepID=UPI0013FD72A6|nr:methyltransferase domain-containing protein [Paraburkholderia hospita]
MPTVSILVPAFKPEYLARALISACTQTFADIEILVGDDTRDGALEKIVSRVGDARVRYFHHGFGNGARNLQQLWARSSGTYIKWLFDDDMLMPKSVETLKAALDLFPQSSLAFHGRVVIDSNDAVVHVPPELIKEGDCALVDRRALAEHMIGRTNNFIGEPSNVMLRRSSVDIFTLFQYRGLDLQFLGDVGMYMNLAQHSPLVAVGGYLSAFRRHDGQLSSRQSPSYSAGLFEWEVMARGEAAAGYLPESQLPTVQQQLTALYELGKEFPEIRRFTANLHELTGRPARELYDSPAFQAHLAQARSAVTERVEAGKRPASAQNFCAVCERPVVEWVPHPNTGADLGFIYEIEAVGSTLEKHFCPHCHCNDRDRHLWLYIAYSGVLQNASEKRILHIAPEAAIEVRIKQLGPREYIGGDLFPRRPDHRKINVEALDFPDDHFDLIICNHVLEHVDNPHAALAEFRRCLAPDGRLIAQTPYSPLLKYTFELNRPASVPFATRYFGQDDHVRLFGSDIVDYFRDAGLKGDLYPHRTVLGDIDPDVIGCNGQEPFFLFAKGDAPDMAVAANA